MRRFVTAGSLALIVALFTGCSEQAKESPTEPQFKKVSNECADPKLIELNAIHKEIDAVFNSRQAKRGAHQIVDNIGRKVCADPANYDATPIMAEGFYQHVLKVDDFNGGLDAAIALVEHVFAFALGTPAFPLPPEAFEPDGGVGVVVPETPDTIWTNNDEAAFVVGAGSYVGPDLVTVVLTRKIDPVSGTPGYPIPGYQAYPEAYNFFANADLTGFAEVWMCVVTDALPVPFENLVIGHNDDGTARLLTPALTEAEPGDLLDCTGADYQPVVEGLAGTPSWLQFAGTVLQPIASRILDVKPLNAMYFAGKGLGGRTGSLSPFAPVDPTSFIPDPVIEFVQSTLNVESPPGSGDYRNTYDFTTTNWADFPPFLFELTSDYGPCGGLEGNPTPSRTWLDIYDAFDDVYIYGFCAFDSPDDLQSYWFSTPAGQGPPDTYMELWDRSTDVRYRSNTVVVPAVFNTLTIAATGNGTVTRPITGGLDIDCHFTNGVADAGDDCAHSAEEWVMYGGFVVAADDGFAFTGWSGPCTGTGPCVVPMDADKTLTANFSPVAGPVLNLTIPARLTVTASSDEVLHSCEGGLFGNTCEYVFGAEDVVTLDAVDWPGVDLPLWLGVICSEGDNQLETCTFPMIGNQTVQLVPDTGV